MGQYCLAEVNCVHPNGRCSGREPRTFLMLHLVRLVGVAFLFLFMYDGFRAQNHEENLGFKDCMGVFISGDFTKIPGFQSSDFGGNTSIT